MMVMEYAAANVALIGMAKGRDNSTWGRVQVQGKALYVLYVVTKVVQS